MPAVIFHIRRKKLQATARHVPNKERIEVCFILEENKITFFFSSSSSVGLFERHMENLFSNFRV
jgi:hypothetical protein